jgi:hypothetical protein
MGFTGPAAIEPFRVDSAVEPRSCPDVSPSLTARRGLRNARGEAAVRAMLRVEQPAGLEVEVLLRYRRDGRVRSADLGRKSFSVQEARGLRLALPASLAEQLPHGTPVTLKLRVTAHPRAFPVCVDPRTDLLTARTRVVGGRHSG